MTESEKRFARWIRDEQDVCRHSLSDEEKAMATRLARRGVLVSGTAPKCRAPHYRLAFLADVR